MAEELRNDMIALIKEVIPPVRILRILVQDTKIIFIVKIVNNAMLKIILQIFKLERNLFFFRKEHIPSFWKSTK